MGTVKAKGKIYENIYYVIFSQDLLSLCDKNRNLIAPIKYNINFHPEVGKTDRMQFCTQQSVYVDELKVNNCALIEGSVQTINAGNCVNIWGDLAKTNSMISQTYNDCKIDYERQIEFFTKAHQYEKKRNKVYLSGDFKNLSVSGYGAIEV